MRFYKTYHQNVDPDGRVTDRLYADPDSGKVLFKYEDKWHISSTLGPKLLVADNVEMASPTEMATQYYVKNGKNFWHGGGKYLWWDGSRYVLSSKLGFGREEEWVRVYDDDDNYDESASYWDGDEWWSCATLEGVYIPRGALKETEDNDRHVALATITGHRRDTLLGVYQELDEAGEVIDGGTTIAIGLPKFTDQNDVAYVRSLEKSGGHHQYGGIHHDGTGWVIGTRDDESGWWVGSEPDIDSSVTFAFAKPAESEIEDQDDLTITFDQFVSGDQTGNIKTFEVSRWMR